jgi:hypothetical protein
MHGSKIHCADKNGNKRQIWPSVRIETDRILKAEIKKRGGQYTKGDLIDQAVQAYFGISKKEDLEERLLQRLDKLKLNVDAARHDVLILTEAFHLFVRVFLTNTPEVPEDNRKSAERRGGERLEVFVTNLADRITEGGLVESISATIQGLDAND